MSIFQLIYVSTASDDYVGESELENILEQSVRNNAADGITGMLLYSSGTFLQVLEGEESKIEECFARIQQDPRHHSLYVLERHAIERGSFSNWHMGFKLLGPKDVAALPGYAPIFESGFDPKTLGAKDGFALELLVDFAERFG